MNEDMSKIYGLIDQASNLQRRLFKAVTVKKEKFVDEQPVAVNYPIEPKIEAKVKECIKANQDLQEAIEVERTCEEKCMTLAAYNRYYLKLVQIQDEFKKANKEIPSMNVEALKLLGQSMKMFEGVDCTKTNEIVCDEIDVIFDRHGALLPLLQEQIQQMRNALEDAIGSVRVYLRIRGDGDIVRPTDTSLMLNCSSDKDPLYEHINRVFQGNQTNTDIASNMQNLFAQLENGYKLVIFGYGSSGSGKTFSLLGAGSSKGVVELAVPSNATLSLNAVYELSNISSGSVAAEKVFVLYKAKNVSLPFKETPLQLTGLNATTPINQVNQLVEDERRRHNRILSTILNPNSSRSHLVIEYKVSFPNGVSTKMVIVDLAGSESTDIIFNDPSNDQVKKRLHISSPMGLSGVKIDQNDEEGKKFRDTMKQSDYINKSLASLGVYLKKRKAGKIDAPTNNVSRTLSHYDTKEGDSKPTKFIMMATLNASVNVAADAKLVDMACNSAKSTLDFVRTFI